MVSTATTRRRPAPEPATALGAAPLGDGRARFCVWAPRSERLAVRLLGRAERLVPLQIHDRGYHVGEIDDVEPGARYLLRLEDGTDRPDPASRSQPDGVHGPSEIVDPHFGWTDHAWHNPPLAQHVIYELHVGAFTPEGTFDAVIPHLDYLRELGITTIELMPIAQFPGTRNWGYDGVGLFAAQNSYGGPAGLKRLVNAAHERGLAVFLDVVYNHLGPEGNYLADFGPYFTERYQTPWGRALNFDGPDSDEVRRFFIENALYWVTDCRIDGLRLDAVHAILDHSALPFVEELIDAVHRRADRLNRRIHVVGESAANDPRLLRPRELGGYGADAQWNDDFHHVLLSLIAPGKGLRYAGFGQFRQLERALTEGFVLAGEHNEHYRRRHGRSSRDVPADRFIVFAQNHDQVGNQRRGERLSHLASPDACRLAAGLVLLSPGIPLLFMGEEHAETAPFLYFVSHGDPALVEAVRRGRIQEFASHGWPDHTDDPQDEQTFARSRLDHALRDQPPHRAMLEFYRHLLALRRAIPALSEPDKQRLHVDVLESERLLVVRRWADEASHVLVVFNFNGVARPVPLHVPEGAWRRLIDSSDCRWGGPGALSPPVLRPRGGLVRVEIAASAFAAYALGGD